MAQGVTEAVAKKSPPTKTVRIHADIERKAGAIAKFRGIDLSDYLSEILRPRVKADFREMKDDDDCEQPDQSDDDKPKRKRQ